MVGVDVGGTHGSSVGRARCLRGGIAMAKIVLKYAGHTTALGAIGWFSLFVGQLTESPLISILVLAIARVLP